jgi:hypothetical protein
MGDEAEDVKMPTHELMAYLNDMERDRFVKLQETFETDGWRLLSQYANEKVIYHGVQGSNATSWEKVNEHRGARETWRQVARWADEFMNAFEAAALLAKTEAADAAQDQ